MMSKVHINASQGIFEVDGDEKFVEKILTDYKDQIAAILHMSVKTQKPNTDVSGAGSSEVIAPKKKSNKGGTKGGPSCADRIRDLIADGYFKNLRKSGDVLAKLKEGGTTYQSNQVAAALNNLTKKKSLRRVNENSVWQYQNP